MADASKIEWTDATFNPWIGCTKVSPGCDHCYAEAWDRRFAWSEDAVHWGAGKARRRRLSRAWRRRNTTRLRKASGAGSAPEAALSLAAA